MTPIEELHCGAVVHANGVPHDGRATGISRRRFAVAGLSAGAALLTTGTL
jgi:hypothetical protein